MMAMYCSTGSLDTLELINCKVPRVGRIDDAGALFHNVKELTLHNVSATRGCLLTDANKLTRLDLMVLAATDILKFLSNDYPRLQSLSLTVGQGSWPKIDIVNFLKHHPDVTELELRNGGNYDLSAIGECHWLRKLTVWNLRYCDVAPIARLDQLTSLKISMNRSYYYVPQPDAIFMASKSFQSLEELVFVTGWTDLRIVRRFINLRRLSILSRVSIDDAFLSDIPRLEELRSLSISGDNPSITSGGLLGLVQRLPHLEQLSIHHDPRMTGGRSPPIELVKSTYSQICDIYRNRNQKLIIYNFDITDDEQNEMNRKEPFAGDERLDSVQFIALDRDGEVLWV